jgi:hypothetical protein
MSRGRGIDQLPTDQGTVPKLRAGCRSMEINGLLLDQGTRSKAEESGWVAHEFWWVAAVASMGTMG